MTNWTQCLPKNLSASRRSVVVVVVVVCVCVVTSAIELQRHQPSEAGVDHCPACLWTAADVVDIVCHLLLSVVALFMFFTPVVTFSL